jgi:hypothetical protein
MVVAESGQPTSARNSFVCRKPEPAELVSAYESGAGEASLVARQFWALELDGVVIPVVAT